MCKKSENNEASAREQAPLLCRFWGGLLRSLPSVSLLGVDVSLTVASALLLALLRYAAEHFLLTRVFGWPADANLHTRYASGCCTSIFHSLNLVPALWSCLRTNKYNPTEAFSQAPQWWQEAVQALLQFCTGYMLYDAIVNLILPNMSQATGWVPSLSRRSHVFGTSPRYCLLHDFHSHHWSRPSICNGMHVSRRTHNPLHNGYYIALEATKLEDLFNGRTTQQLTAIAELAFAVSYILVRLFIAPFVLLHMTVVLWWRRSPKNPVWLVLLWSILIWGVLVGNQSSVLKPKAISFESYCYFERWNTVRVVVCP